MSAVGCDVISWSHLFDLEETSMKLLLSMHKCFKIIKQLLQLHNSFTAVDKTCNYIIEPRHEIYSNVVWVTSKASYQPAHTRSLIRAFACRLNIF